MINTLKIATKGYLKRTAKATLVIAVSGLLSFGHQPPKPIIYPTEQPYDNTSHGGTGRWSDKPSHTIGQVLDEHDKKNEERLRKLREERIRIDDNEVLTIIKIFTQCQA